MIAWTTVEDALHTWVSNGSGITPASVIWGEQDGPRPAGPYIALNITSIQQIGQDGLETEDNPAPSAGAEILHIARGVRRCLMQLQCFGGGATGGMSPEALLEAVIAARILPSNHDPLIAAGVGVAAFTPILSIGGIIVKTVFESRAVTSCRFFLSAEVQETGTFVETVEVTNEVPDPDSTFSVVRPP